MWGLAKNAFAARMNASGTNDTASAKDPYYGVFFRLKTTRTIIVFTLNSNHTVSLRIIQAHHSMMVRIGGLMVRVVQNVN